MKKLSFRVSAFRDCFHSCCRLVSGSRPNKHREAVYGDFSPIALATGRATSRLCVFSQPLFRDNDRMARIEFLLLRWLVFAIAMAGPVCDLHGQDVKPADKAKDLEFFESRIRPVLVKHCFECHSSASTELKGELLVDFRDGLRKGGETGAAIVPGKPGESLLLAALRYESFEMPPSGKLPPRVIADFEKWIRDGAIDPRDKAPTAEEAAGESWKAQLAERSRWWSLQPPNQVSPPNVTDQT